jgi:hypothetical protein
MKFINADLLADITGTYDQTKTTTQGRIQTRTVGGATVIGPPLNKFLNTVVDTTPSSVVTPVLTAITPNGRIFSVGAEASGLVPISLHTINMTTGVTAYVGTIRISIADTATTVHVFRSLKILDAGTTGWRIFLTTTSSTAGYLHNGGTYCANKVDLVDFVSVGAGTLFPNATGSDQKATYFLQDPSNIGIGQLQIASVGSAMDVASNRLYVHNGIAATHQYYVYNTAATLDCPTTAGCVVDDTTDRITLTAHGFAEGTPIYLHALSGGAGLTNNTAYFARNVTANDFQVYTVVTGGTAINITTPGTVSVCRAFGTTGSAWVHKTGNLTVIPGTLLATDSEDYAEPAHTAYSGLPCIFLATTTNLYLGKISDLTSGATSWTLVGSNILAAANQITAPTAAQATWSNVLDRAIYLTNTNILVMKQVVDNTSDRIFCGSNNIFFEVGTVDPVPLQALAVSAMDVEDGWLVLQAITNTGQRGVLVADLRSDNLTEYSYLVTKVLDTPNATYRFLATTNKLEDKSGTITVDYRTSGFGSISGGWAPIAFRDDISAVAAGNQIQFRVKWKTLEVGASIPAQLREFRLGYESNTAISGNWEFSDDWSDNTSPSRITFRLKKAYASTVPQLYFRAYDLSDALLVNNNTVTDIAKFEYSTTNGVSWVPMGTIPNTVGTLVRYTFTSPPGVDIRPGIKES